MSGGGQSPEGRGGFRGTAASRAKSAALGGIAGHYDSTYDSTGAEAGRRPRNNASDLAAATGPDSAVICLRSNSGSRPRRNRWRARTGGCSWWCRCRREVCRTPRAQWPQASARPILVASEICCREMPRFRRILAQTQDAFFFFHQPLLAPATTNPATGTKEIVLKAYCTPLKPAC